LIGAFNSLVEGFEVKSVLEVLRVNEIVYTKQPGVVDIVTSVNTAVVFRVEAQWSELRVLPEIEAARNLAVCAAWAMSVAVAVIALEIVVYEEIGVTPFVVVETFESSCYMFAVFAEVVKHLNVCLGKNFL
jgi:hypothetical protein